MKQSNWEWTLLYFSRKKKEYKLYDWKIKKDRSKTRLGLCNYDKKIISISCYFVDDKHVTHDMIRNVVLHEIAHALTPGHKHDKVWKKKAIKIGCDGKVRGKFHNKPKYNYVVYCKKHCLKKYYYRRIKTENRICNKCKHHVYIKKIKK